MSALAKDELIDGKYRIVRFLGKGAWASVYEGVNIRLHRRVAIKVLGQETLQHPGVVERFEREGQAATQIESDHVVDIFDIGSLEDGRPYMVMEFLDGEDLGKVFEKAGVLPPERAVFYAVQALRGLADAHAAGVLHRDIKPANVVLVKKQGEEIVKIVDFGISKLHSGAVPQPTAMTQTNAVLGSPVYMSPEQCRGARLMDHRSDLYSLGVVLYEALTGKVPHIADTFNALMFKIALEDVPDPRTLRPDLDDGLVAIVLKALSRDAEKRYQTALEFRTALVQWAERHDLEPHSWPSGSVRNMMAAVKASGAAPKAQPVGEDAKDTRMLTESGERRQRLVDSKDEDAKGDAPTMPAPPLSESAAKSEPQISVSPTSASRPTEPSAMKRAEADKRPLYFGVGAIAVAIALAIGVTRKSDPPAEKTGIVATSTATAAATPSATATEAATETPTPTPSASASASAVATEAPVESATAPTTATAAPVVHATVRAPATAKPITSASASAKTSPPGSASAKAVIDGRTIHTKW